VTNHINLGIYAFSCMIQAGNLLNLNGKVNITTTNGSNLQVIYQDSESSKLFDLHTNKIPLALEVGIKGM
jgi:hypothetical protein